VEETEYLMDKKIWHVSAFFLDVNWIAKFRIHIYRQKFYR